MIVYATSVDCGDGSTAIEFFEETRSIEFLQDLFPEYYRDDNWTSLEVVEPFPHEVLSHEDAVEMAVQWTGGDNGL